jgi:hypothetical protein
MEPASAMVLLRPPNAWMVTRQFMQFQIDVCSSSIAQGLACDVSHRDARGPWRAAMSPGARTVVIDTCRHRRR